MRGRDKYKQGYLKSHKERRKVLKKTTTKRNKKISSRSKIAPFKILRDGPRDPTPIIIQDVPIVFGCLPELEDKTLLLQTLWTLITELRETKLILNQKPSP